MKKCTRSIVALLGLMSLLSMQSCKKIWDEIKHHPNGTADNCRIEKIYTVTPLNDDQGNPYDFKDTITFTYDVKGNPVTIRYASSPFGWDVYGRNRRFIYDAQNRLSVYLENIGQALGDDSSYKSAGLWHKYVYPNATQVVDSVFSYTDGDIATGSSPLNYSGLDVQTYNLDSYGRIISWSDQFGHSVTYTYDSNGNLVRPGVTYSNKTNIYQTNKTWMFLAKDYSVNSANGVATQFNANKLPVNINTNMLPLFLYDYDTNIVVTYQCK
jgi:YD repeat-containing protein